MFSTLTAQARGLTGQQRHAFTASYFGWAMDSFDYFLVVLVYADIAKEFGVSLTQMAFLTTVTLLARPAGALVFGLWADRRGRREALMVNVTFYSAIGLLCAFAPNYTALLVLRALFGLGMGGEWGLSAALAMEKVPVSKRGFYSGLLQGGYCFGYLMAALVYLAIEPMWGWRALFAFSVLPALISLHVRSRVRESEVWERSRQRIAVTGTSMAQVFRNPLILRRFGYLVALMAVLNWMNHSTQDIYPTFLKAGAGMTALGVTGMVVVYNVGAILGCLLLGTYSEQWGRRRMIMVGALLGLPILPLFVLHSSVVLLALGSFLMGFVLQGAWGAIPAHLTELSPNEIRGFYPGVTYQLGNLIAALNLPIQQALVPAHGYVFALVATIAPALVVAAALTAVGKEAKGVSFDDAATGAH